MDKQTSPSAFRRFLPLIIFVALSVLLYVGLQLNPREVPSPLVGKPAPEFDLPKLLDQGRISDQDFKGKITLLNVWASWCFACRQEHQVVKYLGRQGVRVIGFNYKDEPEDAKAWLEKLGNPYLEIAADHDGRAAIDWGVYGAPETFLVDKNGIIQYKVIGPLDSPKIMGAFLERVKALAEKDPDYQSLEAALESVYRMLRPAS
jgi:cytochrome c biogenesis protein CcmG/thiol:disulfide interchange protein DsbE